MVRFWSIGAVVLAASGAASGSAFNVPLRVGDGLGAVEHAALTMDRAGNPAIVFTAAGRIYFASGWDAFSTVRLVGSEDGGMSVNDAPALETDAVGVTYIAFRVENGGAYRDIAWTLNRGGSFREPWPVPGSSHAGLQQPAICVMPDGAVLIGWSARDGAGGAGDGIYYYQVGSDGPVRGLYGAEAAFAVDGSGRIHVAYIRGGDVYYSWSSGAPEDFAVNERRYTHTPVEETAPRIAVTADGFPFVTYVVPGPASNQVVLTGGDGTAHRVLAAGAPFLRCVSVKAKRAGASYAVTFASGSAVHTETGVYTSHLGFVGHVQVVCPLEGGEDLVDVAIDDLFQLHVIVSRHGQLLYRNNAPPPEADFEALDAGGEVPLTVEFRNRSRGCVLQYAWDFGDGKTSVLEHPVHRYETTGVFTVTLRVTGTAGAADATTRTDLVRVERKRNQMRIPDTRVYAGQKRVKIPVKVTSVLPFQGFQLVGRYDPRVLALAPGDGFIDLEHTVTAAAQPDFVAPGVDREAGTFFLGVIFDSTPPITGKEAPPCARMNLVNLVVDVAVEVANRTETRIELENGVGRPPLSNILTVNGGVSVHPELTSGTLTILRPDIEFAGPLFVRGDANHDGVVSIADGIYVLAYLFAGGSPPFCMDAADVDDDGHVNIGDAIAVLSYLFANQASPAFPFPSPGLDPTPDALPACGEI